LTPPTAFPQVNSPEGAGPTAGAAAVLGVLGGVAVGAGAVLLKQMGNGKKNASDASKEQG